MASSNNTNNINTYIQVDLHDEWVNNLVVTKLLDCYKQQQDELVKAIVDPTPFNAANAAAACEHLTALRAVLNYFGHDFVGDVTVADAQEIIDQVKESNASNKAKRRRRTVKS